MLVSVILTNYNDKKWLEERVPSILKELDSSQAASSSELLIVDDGSSDGSIEFIKTMSDPRIRLIQHPRNFGTLGALNTGLRLSQGEFVAFFAADDITMPGFFDEHLNMLIKNPDIPFSAADTGYLRIGRPIEETRIVSTLEGVKEPIVVRGSKEAIRYKRNAYSKGFPVNCALMRRDALVKRGGLRDELTFKGDWYTAEIMMLEEGFIYIPKCLGILRTAPTTYGGALVRNKMKRRDVFLRLMNLLETEGVGRLFAKTPLLSPILRECFPIFVWRPTFWKYYIGCLWAKIQRWFHHKLMRT